MSWENLEKLMTQLLMLDKAMTVPGSGNGKGEEDVIGLSTITQCKFSETKNVTILRKDIDRLLDAAKLQGKIPIFVTENNGLKLVSIPESPIFKDILHMIVAMSLMRFVQAHSDYAKTSDQKQELKKLALRSQNIMGAIIIKYNDIDIEQAVILNDPEKNIEYLQEFLFDMETNDERQPEQSRKETED